MTELPETGHYGESVHVQAANLYFLPPDTRVLPVRASPRKHRRAICSLALGMHSHLQAVASPTLVAYAKRWKWDVVLSSENLANDRPPAWAKVRLMQQLLDEYEMILWIDSDALIVELDRDIMAELPQTNSDIYLVEHAQAAPENAVVPNSGVLLLRRSPYTADFLKRMWDMTEFIEHNWWENAALLAMLGHSLEAPWQLIEPTSDRAHVGFLDLAWNSVPDLCESDKPVVRHHARADNRSFERRLAGMVADLSTFLTLHE